MSREFGSSGMPCSITDGPASSDDAIHEEREEREYDKYQDSDPEDYADLRAELVAITRLQAITSRIESLGIDIRSKLIGKPRA